LPCIRKEIDEKGPLSSIDLDYGQTVDWPWAPTRLARAALESMYFQGELVIHHKVTTRKFYDFSVRHIPQELLLAPDPNLTEEQYRDWHVLRRIGGVGLLWNRSGDAWLGIPGVKGKERNAALSRLLEQEKVREVSVDGLDEAFYLRSRDAGCFDRILSTDDTPARAVILAPLDNMLWDRRLVKELFDFEYRWEVYKPVSERDFGYYVLPVLYGDRFVARFEPGRDKSSGALVIKNWWWEPGLRQSRKLQSELLGCFKRFLGFLGCQSMQISEQTLSQSGLHWLKDVKV
jgi:hypothetical protein